MKRILVVGSLNMDIVFRMPRMPQPGETLLGTDLRYTPGGKGANQSFSAGRLGGNVIMLGCVGTDTNGDTLVSNLHKAGVDVSRIGRSNNRPTGTAAIYVDDDGMNSIVVIPGANEECDEKYLRANDSAFEESDYVLLQMEIPSEAVAHTIRKAKELGKTVILNPAPAPDVMPTGIFKKVDYLTPNENELERLCGGAPVKTVEDMTRLAEGMVRSGAVNALLVTVGSKGCIYVDREKTKLFPATDIKPVDTTAAGDCFNAAFVLGLAEGKTPEEAIVFANAAAGIAVSRPGAQSSIPIRAEVDGYIQDQKR